MIGAAPSIRSFYSPNRGQSDYEAVEAEDARTRVKSTAETPDALLSDETMPGPKDPDSRRWLAQLRSVGAPRDQALRRLHELLLKMAYARLMSRHAQLPREALDEVALDVADEALVGVLSHLDDFRGASRFTTWACQFAVTEVYVAMRRYRRHRQELPIEPEVIVLLAGSCSSVERRLEQAELLRLVCEAVNDALTEHQREVLLALAVRGESAEAVATQLETNAGALYKSLHDARRKLRARLAAQGLDAAG